MKWNELQVGDWYQYPQTSEFDLFTSIYMKTTRVWDDQLQSYCDAVGVFGEDVGLHITHDNDPVWDNAEVTVYQVEEDVIENEVYL